jgi:hypothetical protein
MSGVWCLVSGVWCLVSGVWCLVSGVWCLVSGVWGVKSKKQHIEDVLRCDDFRNAGIISWGDIKYTSNLRMPCRRNRIIDEG